MNTKTVSYKKWSGGQHPTLSNVTRLLQAENLRPYMWENHPNHRYAVRTHGYDKVLYVIEGMVEIILPDENKIVVLRAGDRVDIPAGVRHGTNIGKNGAKCVEASVSNRQRARRLS